MARNYSSIVEPKALAADITSTTATTITLNNTTGLPSPPYVLVINPDTASEEAVLVTSNASSPTLTVTRAIETGATGKTHTAGHIVKHMIVGSDLQVVHDHFSATTGVHGLGTGVSPAPLASPTFTGTVVLPSTTSIGTVSSTEIGYVDGVTSSIQTQLNTKAPSTSPAITGGTINGGAALTVDSTELNKLDGATATTAELNYVTGVTSAIQTQLDAKATTSALTTHEADTTSIHGITDTSKLAKIASVSDGRTIFVQAAQPTALATGDIWFQVTGL
jgi:hypothetical protein